MPYQILPAASTRNTCPSKTRHQKNDVSQLLVSLQARLGFAQFKMKQGWETSTLLDVEQLWKQKQQKLISELPKPRFTQRDIIDKKIFMPSPGAKHQAKKARLVRTYSFPTEKKKPIRQQQQPPPPQSPDTSSLSSLIEEEEEVFHCPSPPLRLRNSLDYLSYAIAMTEQQQPSSSSQPLPDVSEVEPHLTEEEDYTIVEQANSPPSSPVTSAAKAIMMFVNNNQPPQH
ncbi:uncharacterized protein B0P05DRAFT_639115 [Gilbertella persicaria]|uniref:Uncharacterized protein n=1 Tax=Rhizopus stolonifer TaxID=4846 RepID=A0A367KWT7_RHIST|nr:uncharacterized protein B0P05DRAFT_639115 [Gilbertella persicaria]KAI8071152.1 hypothetical protein B0P05DRAFT_639115 [Gilbertella persicaria]RCI06656.1 hypothetical protein CU098_011007 [Rhizopus stolonifer]